VSGSAGLSGTAATKVKDPWTAVWLENFDGSADRSVDTSDWEFDTGQGKFGTGEIETMTSSLSNIHLTGDGGLDIVTMGQGAAGGTSVTTWTSGRIQTKRMFAAPAGGEMMVTASIKQPDPKSGLGYWPGFWMLGVNPWPTGGEIDIMEDVDGLSQESGTLHCGDLTTRNSNGTYGPCHEDTGVSSGLQPCPNCQTSFNTYTVIVDRRHAGNEQIRWYLNGREFYSVSESQVGQAVWTAAVDHGFTVLLSVAMGGSFPDTRCGCTAPTAQTTSPATMTVKYVHVYTN
jgi:beta-glucanase (GH16 family)